MSMRQFIRIVESAHHETQNFANGWWVLPDGRVEECPTLGSHAATARHFLTEPSSEPVEALKGQGGVRCAVFPSSPPTMNIDLDPDAVTEAARRGLLRLMMQTREHFAGYYFEHVWQARQDNGRRDYREAVSEIRHLRETEYPRDVDLWESVEADFDDNRVLFAYLKKHKLDLYRMDDAEIERHRAAALANRHLYPIPVTEPGYLYHGTAKTRLPDIARKGLIPSERSRWGRSGLTYHSLGRVFFANTILKADFYARAAAPKNHVFLRVRRDALPDVKPDTEETEGCCFFVERTVPPEEIEVWTGKSWKKLV